MVDKSTTEESKDDVDQADGKVDDKDETGNTLWIVIAVVAVVLVAGVVTAIVLSKKKKEQVDANSTN